MDRNHLLAILKFQLFVKRYTKEIIMSITELTIQDLLDAELTRRLSNYPQTSLADKATHNDRYLCLQTALYMVQGGKPPQVEKNRADVIAEMQTWRRELQRDATVDTMYITGRKVELIDKFIEQYRERAPEPEQLKIL